MRSLLRREYNFSRTPGRTYSVPCVFSTEQLRYPKPDGGVCQSKSFVGEGVKLDCAGGFGAVTMVTATFGMVAAAKAVDKLVAGARRPSGTTPAADENVPQPLCDAAPRKVPLSQLYISAIWLTYAVAKIAPTQEPISCVSDAKHKGNFG